MPERYCPYGISKSLGEEYRNILKRQNAFLASVQMIRAQGLKEEIFGAESNSMINMTWKWSKAAGRSKSLIPAF